MRKLFNIIEEKFQQFIIVDEKYYFNYIPLNKLGLPVLD
jgi:hypothetical protein